MKHKPGSQKPSAEETIKDIRRATRRHWSAEDKIRIVLDHAQAQRKAEIEPDRMGDHFGWVPMAAIDRVTSALLHAA